MHTGYYRLAIMITAPVGHVKLSKMARPTDRTRHPLSKAALQLRLALGETQQQFAARLGTAITTIARYETVRPPSGLHLGPYLKVAAEHRFLDIAIVFKKAIEREFGVLDGPLSYHEKFLERHLVDVLEQIQTICQIFESPDFTVEQAKKAGARIKVRVDDLLAYDDDPEAEVFDPRELVSETPIESPGNEPSE